MKILLVIHDLGYADHISLSYLSAIAKQLNHSTYFCSIDRNDMLQQLKKLGLML
jgi:hypothetical protein